MVASAVYDAREAILKQWEVRSREKFPAAWDKAKVELRDHLPELVLSLCDFLNGKGKGDATRLSQIHGYQRFSFGDYTVHDVLGEYKLLKEIIYHYLDKPDPIETQNQIKLVGSFFDDVSTSAVAEFAALREKELKDAATHLEKSNDELERFTAVVAHDLRSPLATMIGFCDLLKEENDPRQTKEFVQIIFSNATRSVKLIDRLLEYTKIGQAELRREAVDLNLILNAAKENLYQLLEESQATVTSDNLKSTIGDPILFVQLFQNLLANSLKFRKKNEPCVIKIYRKSLGGGIEKICVEDNGVGFDPEKSEEIFKPFKRAHSDAEYKGSGLGLATCQKVVESYGGAIEAHGSVGKGATFCFTLPGA